MTLKPKGRLPYPAILKGSLRKTEPKHAIGYVSRLRRQAKLYDAVWKYFALSPGDWKGLAKALLERHVPAFRIERRGKRKAKVTDDEWEEFWVSGGAGFEDEVEQFIQACFVICVSDLAAQHGLEATFRRLAKDNSMLSARYRARTTASSLKQAYFKVPELIRKNPRAFVPGTNEHREMLKSLKEAEEGTSRPAS